jgi:hypothetical protein
MKAFSFTVCALAVLPAMSSLAGCDNAGTQSQSQFVSSQARSQVSPQNIRHMTGTEQTKVGQFWWVSNTESFHTSDGVVPVEADCPNGYLPTGGGYNIVQNVKTSITDSYPLGNGTAAGWGVDALDLNSYTSIVTVWAICAKKK